jgi:UDP-glucose 4-epimerase
MGRRVLVTGLGTFWGGRAALALEADPNVDVIIGLDTHEPTVELERTEFVRVDNNYSILARIVAATGVDTIVHTFLTVDPTLQTHRAMHETNVIGTMNLFAAASERDSTVRSVVVKSSTVVYGCSPRDPTYFREQTPPSQSLRPGVERSLSQVEDYVRDFAEDNPHVRVTLLRFTNVIGQEIITPLTRALEMPLVPSIAGFDPRFQFVHEDDVIRAILHVLEHDLNGIYNVAGDGMLPWSEVVAMAGKRRIPLPPFISPMMLVPGRLTGLLELPDEYLRLLRYGRGVDNRRLKKTGFRYDYSSAQAVMAFVEAVRLRASVGSTTPTFTYERDVEQFFRHSPAIIRNQLIATPEAVDTTGVSEGPA